MESLGLSPHAAALLGLTLVAFVLFASEKLPVESTGLLVLVCIVALFQVFPYGDVSPVSFFYGFGHEALVAICALMVLGRGLVATGALVPMSRLLARLLEASPHTALLVVLVLCAAASGVLNDTPIVVLMLPVLVLIGDIVGVFGGYAVSVYNLGFSPGTYVTQTWDILERIDVISGLVKAAVFGFIVAIMGCYHVFISKRGAQGVGAAQAVMCD